MIEGLLQNKTEVSTVSEEEHILEKTSKTGRCKRCYESILKGKGTYYI